MFSIFSSFYFAKKSSSPKKFVKEFIKDYHKWYKTASRNPNESKEFFDVSNKTKENYFKNIVDKYCQEDFKSQPVSFSEFTAHEPQKEKIISERINENQAIVITEMDKMSDFQIRYEYRLIRKDKKWNLTAVDYLDGNCTWPSL